MLDYKTAGVDIEAGYKSVELMKKHVKETMRPEVLGGLGGFAGAFDLSGIKEYGRTSTSFRNRWMWNKGEACICNGQA